MSDAQEVLHPQQFFHGSHHQFSPGENVTPGHDAWATDDPHAYFTPSKDVARDYGAHVHEVVPTGPYEPDKIGENRPSYKSLHPLRVIGEAPESRGAVGRR